MRTISVILDETICAMEHWLVDAQLNREQATGARLEHLWQDRIKYETTPEPPQVIAIRDLQMQAYELSIELKQRGL